MCFGGLTYAFCVSGKSGNPSFILVSKPGEPVSEQTCYRLASHFGCEVTWVKWLPDSATYQLRYFVSNGEIDFCGHGTLAAASWLSKYHEIQSPISFRVLDRRVSVRQNESGDWSYEQQAFPLRPITEGDSVTGILASLGFDPPSPLAMNQVQAYRSAGSLREKLIVAFPDRKYLEKIQINGQRRDQICETLNATGIYAFCDISDPHSTSLAARHFPVYSGEHEDLATGAIAPTIAWHISQNKRNSVVNIFQGGTHSQHARILVSADTTTSNWHVGGLCQATECIPLQEAFNK